MEAVVVATMEVEGTTDGENVCATTAGNLDILRETADYREEETTQGTEMMQTEARMETLCREQIVMQSLVLLEHTNLASSVYKMDTKWCGVDRVQNGTIILRRTM